MEKFLSYLKTFERKQIEDIALLEKLLIEHWDQFKNSYDTHMAPYKLEGRIESPFWDPPILSFNIERHGMTVSGSTKAEVQQWSINLETLQANQEIINQRRVAPNTQRINVNLIADEIISLIIEGRNDDRLNWFNEDKVTLQMKNIPELTIGKQQTIAERRIRFRKYFDKQMLNNGWMRKGNFYTNK